MPGVFAAGDAVTGPATVVEAVAHGNRVALAVDHYLHTGELSGVYDHPKRYDIVEQLFDLERLRRGQPRPQTREIPVEESGAATSDEVELAVRRGNHPGGVQALPALRPGLAGEMDDLGLSARAGPGPSC